jgi:dihydrolipoamide dehydrogenase
VPEHNADLVVLGGGSGGYAAALRAAELGMSVVLVERDKLGGTCLHYGCIPTKALLHAAEVADAAREGDKIGVKSSVEGIDMAGVNGYKDGVVAKLYKGLQGLVKSRKINLVDGTGRFEGPNTVVVGDDRYVGRNVVLATGSYAKSLPGLDIGGRIITSNEAIHLDAVPNRVVVLGGGVIGVEFASVFRSFGAEVTIVEALPRLVPAEDEFSSKQLERAFRRRKIAFKTGVMFTGAKQNDDAVTVSLESGEEIEADLLLVAVGRGPNTAGHGYDLAGNGKSQILQTQGAIKLIKAGGEGTQGPVVGIHMVGARVGELIGEAQLVYNWDAQAEDVAALVHAHPTQNEAFGEAHLALAGKPLHSHS